MFRLRDVEADIAVDAYWQRYLLSESADDAARLAADSFLWACEWVDSVVAGELKGEPPMVDPNELLLQLAKRAPDDPALRFLGSGPLERYLRRPDADIDAIDRAARRDRRFRLALRWACFTDGLPSSASQRLRRWGPPW